MDTVFKLAGLSQLYASFVNIDSTQNHKKYLNVIYLFLVNCSSRPKVPPLNHIGQTFWPFLPAPQIADELHVYYLKKNGVIKTSQIKNWNKITTWLQPKIYSSLMNIMQGCKNIELYFDYTLVAKMHFLTKCANSI